MIPADEIDQIIKRIERKEYENKGLIDDEIHELGYFVISVHEMIEGFIDSLVLQQKPNQNIETVNKLHFWEKVEICQNLLEGVPNTISKFDRVNRLRIEFTHPQSYRSRLTGYIDTDESYLGVMKQLDEAIDILEKHGV